jgi:hypothetical protein
VLRLGLRFPSSDRLVRERWALLPGFILGQIVKVRKDQDSCLSGGGDLAIIHRQRV